MNCSICGNGIGLWAKLTAHSTIEVCKKCHEQGQSQLQVLVTSVNATQSFKKEFAERWLNQFGDSVRKYKIPEDEARPLRHSLLNGIFKQVEAQDEMVEADLRFLAEIGTTYALGRTASPELQDTIFRVGMREIIQSWELGDVPTRQCGGLVLQKGEVCHWEEGAGLRVQKTKHAYVGGYSSVSVPIVRGVRFKVGGFRGHPVDHTVWEDGGTGVFHITNQRVCFTGQRQSVAITFKKMISVSGFDGGFIVQTANEKKPGIFIVRHPEFTTQMVTLASNPTQGDCAPRKRSQRLPSAV
jgi:hypothetical protein